MRILEREALLARLIERLGGARRGSGRLVLVAGEAGIGKTAIVDAFLAALPRGTTVLRGACDPVVPARAFAPIADIAADFGDGLPQALASADRDRVFDRFLALLRRVGSGSVVVLEDLHWVDSATIDLLKVVGRRLPDLPVLILGTYRPRPCAWHSDYWFAVAGLDVLAERVRLTVTPSGHVHARSEYPAAPLACE